MMRSTRRRFEALESQQKWIEERHYKNLAKINALEDELAKLAEALGYTRRAQLPSFSYVKNGSPEKP